MNSNGHTINHHKSPGSDGFTVEFFKVFWQKLGHFVVRSLNEGFQKGELSSTQKEGIIICIPKADKDRNFIKNWRPISLLNVVYKIGSSCIANRIEPVLPMLINDQTGFISNRCIFLFPLDHVTTKHNLISKYQQYKTDFTTTNISILKRPYHQA